MGQTRLFPTGSSAKPRRTEGSPSGGADAKKRCLAPSQIPIRNVSRALVLATRVDARFAFSLKAGTAIVGQTLVFLGAGHESFRDGRSRDRLQRHDGPFERNLQHFVHGLNTVNRETGEDLLRDFRQVLLIVLRNEYRTQAHSVGGQKLLFEAADGENFAAQGNFAGHGHITAHRNLSERADDGRADGDAGGGTVLRDGAFGNVHVNIESAVEISWQAELRGARARVTHGRLRGFLHDVAERSGNGQVALPFV